ncbi:hypothetical protein Tco_1065102 [Tanacetum coccineum]
MAALPICDELCRTTYSSDWEPQFILYCQRAMSEDVRLARQINALCDILTDVIDGREDFFGNWICWPILGREFELRAREKDLFIEKLKVSCSFPFSPVAGFSMSCVVVAGAAEDVLVFLRKKELSEREWKEGCILERETALAVLITGASQSRQHDMSEPARRGLTD